MHRQNKSIQWVLLVCLGCFTASGMTSGVAGATEIATAGNKPLSALSSQKLADGPRIELEEPINNLGNVKPNTTHTCRFPFKNIGTAPLIIQKVQTTCSCSTPELKKLEYAPGESGTIIVHFEASHWEGSTSKRLYVLSNAMDAPKAELTIKAAVVVPWEVIPRKITLDYRAEGFGRVPISVRSKDGKPFRITGAASADKALTMMPRPDIEGTKHALRLQVDKGLIKKGESGIVVIKTTHPEFANLWVPYTTRQEFEIFPQRIIFFNVGPQTRSVRHITIKNNYGEPVKVTSAKSLNGYTQVLSIEAEGPSVKLAVTCQLPTHPTTSQYLSDELEISLSGGRIYKIPCNIWLKDSRQAKK